jgi:hypothetical protein
METQIIQFKKNAIEEIKKSYEKNKSILTANYKKDISILSLLRNRNVNINIIRNLYINALTKSYNSNLRSLTQEMNNNINKINNYVINIPIAQATQTQISNTKSALLIGINYRGTSDELFGCINDANSMKDLLIGKDFRNINILTDDTFIKPTRQNIMNELKTLLINAKAGDTLFFSYSGHGSYILDKNGDEKDGKDELLVSLDMKAIVDDELKNIIQNNLKEGVTLFALIDSCHSGTVLDLKYQYLDSENSDNLSENNNNSETLGNIYMISGCMDSQTSIDAYINNKAQGAMTWSFLQSLRTMKNPTWRELVKNMRNLLKINGLEQIPQLSSGKKIDIDTKFFI